MRRSILSALSALLLVSCGSAQTVGIPVSSVLDENTHLRAENERLRSNANGEAELMRSRARDAKRKSDVMAYATAAQLWAADHAGKLPVAGDNEFQALMVSGRYIVRVTPPATPGEHYCYATSRDLTEYSFSAWTEEDDAPYTVGNDMAASVVAKAPREAFFGSPCPRIPGWAAVAV
jgi:hypothetical protein